MAISKRAQTKLNKAMDEEVSRAYAVSCSGIQVSIWDLTKISDTGKAAYLAGKRGVELEAAILEYVNTIRKN